MTLARSAFRTVVIVLAALLASTGWPASAARAADDSNIPGVPLPGPTVTGTLGGPVYDRVYSIDVPADRVILLALSGDAGTDFDLYLFDGSATTVYSTAGQVASSTSSGSSESISYATNSGGRFYIDLNGASNVLGNFRLSVKVVADTTPPHLDLRINDGDPATPDSTVRVTLVATDDLSGVTDMQFSLDGGKWDAWRAYVPVTLWSFPQVDGPRRLSARVRDRSGNVSAAASATILIDTLAPSVVSRSPGPDQPSTSLRPVFRIVFSESIRLASWTSLGLVLQDPAGGTVHGTYAYNDDTQAGTFVPAADLTAGVTYIATLGAVTDLAGNALSPVGSWVVRPLRSHTATLTATVKAVPYGTDITLRGHVDPPLGASVTIERSVAGGSWAAVASAHPDAAGDFTTHLPGRVSGRFRVHIPANATENELVSPTVSVAVGPVLALQGQSPSITRRVTARTPVALRATISPAAPAAVVTFNIYRYDSTRRTYVAAGVIRRGTSSGVAALTWKPTVKGSYYVRLSTPATAQLAAGISAAYRWLIT